MDDIALPYYIADARTLPIQDTTAVKQSLVQLVGQFEKLLPTMLAHELPLWLERYEKIEQGRWKYLIASHAQAQALANWHQFRHNNPEAIALPASRDALEFGLHLGIEPNQWQDITPKNLRERLQMYLCDIRANVFLASLDVLYLRAIAPITLAGDHPEIHHTLDAMIDRLSQSIRKK
jgi:hypothetical protein